MKPTTKFIIGLFAFLLIMSIVYGKTDSEKLDDLKNKTDKIEKILEKLEQKMDRESFKLDVFGTEYYPDEKVTVWLQFLEDSYIPVNNATCFLTMYYPDKSIWFHRSIMTYLDGSNAIYYFDGTSQSQKGVYMADAVCQFTTQDLNYNATGVTLINATYVSGTNDSVTRIDEDRYIVEEVGGADCPGRPGC